MLRLNAMKSKLVMTIEQNSNTTNVKVKLTPSSFNFLAYSHSNTTNVKVKLLVTFAGYFVSSDSNTTNVKVKQKPVLPKVKTTAAFKYNQC